jgi:O-succinylbenzoic acid--CoA ligase
VSAISVLLDGLRARGGAVCLRGERDLDCAHVAGMVEEDLLGQITGVAVAPNDVVALRGLEPGLAISLALCAWRRGISTYVLAPRASEDRARALVRAAGCRQYVGRTDGAIGVATLPEARPLPGPTSTLLLTSGTSGGPKVAVTALEAHVACARAAARFFDLGPGDTWLLSLPLHHVGGLAVLMRTLVSGAVLAVPAPGESLAASLVRLGATHVSLVDTQLRRLLRDDAGQAALRRLRAVLVGGGPLPAALRTAALDAGVALVVSYGSTETTAFVAATGEPDIVRRPHSAGRPLPHRTVEVLADGEILVGGEGLLRGYLAGGDIVDPRDERGFLATGDRGRIDEDGVLYVEGRRDRMFVSGGENVQPEAIEAALLALPGITAACVVDAPHPEYGRRPVAFVRAADGAVSESRVRDALREVLAGFEVPDAVYELPRAAADGLKPDLAALRTLLGDPTRAGLRRL